MSPFETFPNPIGTYIGTTPAGVEWVCWKRPDESEQTYQANIATMREAFDRMVARQLAKRASR